MKCQECVAAGLRSRFYEKPKIINKGAKATYYDEDGGYHVHDGTVVVSPFDCSNGHHWEHLGRNPCPTCGVPVNPEAQP